MSTEFELKFLINPHEFKGLLLSVGASLIAEKRLMRRKTFHFDPATIPPGHQKWARVRDEGNKVTMTVKQITQVHAISGTQEIEIVVNDFDQACTMLETIGLTVAAYQETYREEWSFNTCSITIDEWPGLPPFIEIEGESEHVIMHTAHLLNCDIDQVLIGSVDVVYEKIHNIPPLIINTLPSLTFDTIDKVLDVIKKSQ